MHEVYLPAPGAQLASSGQPTGPREGGAEAIGVLIRKTGREIWLNRVRVWLPPALVVVALLVRKPAWHWWGVPLVLLGEAIRTWAAGHLLKDEALTVGGPYGYVRNPLYLGSLISTIGFLAILGDFRLAVAFLAIALAIYLPIVRQEENYLRRMHGAAFHAYAQAVPALIPRLKPYRGQEPAGVGTPALQSRFEWRRVWLNKEHKTWAGLVVLFGLLALRARLSGHP